MAGTAGHSFASLTGNPATDGWTYLGNSAPGGNYIDGAGAYSADMYTTAFTLSSGSPLISALGGYNWSIGDTIVGVGGVFTATGNGDLTYSGSGGSTSTRIVIKYGSASAAWTTTPPPSGSLVNGGVGSVLLGTYAYDFSPANSGVLITPASSPQQQTGPSSGNVTSISAYMGRVTTEWSGGEMVGFESFLNLTLLNATYPTSGVALGNKFVLDLQRGTSSTAFQNSLGTLPSEITAVPEPATMIAGALLLLPFGASTIRILRKNRAA